VTEIKVLMVSQLYGIAKLLAKTSEGYKLILEVIIPIINQLLITPSNEKVKLYTNLTEIVEGAMVALTDIAKLLKKRDINNYVLTMTFSRVVS